MPKISRASYAPLLVLATCTVAACGREPAGDNAAVSRADQAAANDKDQPVQARPPVSFGRAATVGGVDFALTSVVENTTLQQVPFGPKLQPGEVFVIVRYRVTNVSGVPIDGHDRPKVFLLDASGNSYIEDDVAAVSATGTGEDTGDADLNPDIKARSVKVWRAAKGALDKAAWRIVVGGEQPVTFALQ